MCREEKQQEIHVSHSLPEGTALATQNKTHRKVINLMVMMMIIRKVRIIQLMNFVVKRAIPKLFAKICMVIHLNYESHVNKEKVAVATLITKEKV